MASEVIHSPLNALSFLIGTWHTEGEVMKSSISEPAKIRGTDIYKWVLDGKFILHLVEVMMGDVKTEAMELIGAYDKERNTYLMRSFDNTGTFTIMHATMNGEAMVITGDNMRSKLGVDKDGNIMRAHWELSDGKTWAPWMDLTLTKL